MLQKDTTSKSSVQRESILIRYMEYVTGRVFKEDKLKVFSGDTGSGGSAADFRLQQGNAHSSETGEINIRLDRDVELTDGQQFWANSHLSEAAAHLDMSA